MEKGGAVGYQHVNSRPAKPGRQTLQLGPDPAPTTSTGSHLAPLTLVRHIPGADTWAASKKSKKSTGYA